MTAIPVLNPDGLPAGQVALGGPIAEQEIKPHLIHETVVAELAARRAGTHATKSRSDVSGGGRKPWRQKGTGRARQGSIRAPQWRGGGVVFGPTPRTHGGKVNRKVRAQAFRAALRAHVERGGLAVMDATGWDAPSSKRAANYLYQAPAGLEARPLLVVLDDPEGVEGLSFRNLSDVYVLASAELEVVDIMAARSLLVQRSVWERITHGELDVTEVAATAKTAPERQAPPEPRKIEKPKADKPKRGRRRAAADEEPTAEVAEAEVAETAAEVEEAPAVTAEAEVEETPVAEEVADEPTADEVEADVAEDDAADEGDAADEDDDSSSEDDSADEDDDKEDKS